MEYCSGGTLQKHIESRKHIGFSMLRIGGYIQQLVDGLLFIHSCNVTHRDMKSENIMMTQDLDIKISDFGTGKALPEGCDGAMTMTGGDIMVIPPEFAHRAQGVPTMGLVGPKYDMWGLGCIIGEMVTLKILRKDRCRQQPLCLNQKEYSELIKECKEAHKGRFYSLIHGLLQKDPNKRLSSSEVSQILEEALRTVKPPLSSSAQCATIERLLMQGYTQAQCDEVWQMFRQADVDGIGQVSIKNLRALLAMLHIQASATVLMKQFGNTHTDGMNFMEFATWWLGRNTTWVPSQILNQAAPDQTVLKIFSITPEVYEILQTEFLAWDPDNSGTITVYALYLIATGKLGLQFEWDSFTATCGQDWADKVMTFSDVLYWCQESVDWRRKSLIMEKAKGETTYNQGDPVSLLRSSGAWEKATVQEVKDNTYVIVFNGNTKVIPFKLAGKFLKSLNSALC
uniref:non-specific serine/threonine protein kinase n=2 Tax=Eutreptiella gymnastica TaxID=73025 RepID=A0A7S1IRU3_9EUGL|mmetsp:Transcript_37170/g.66332  ORF Transcript_37170/g.66332 Transcript_37170/m.66332 type:complete len:455 (+) Transcript_37170:65-1429(+)